MSSDIPSDLEVLIKPGNAINGKRIACRANDIKLFRVSHKKAGGRGQGASIKDGICWIEREYVRLK